ncbi:MAG: HNH endonuclease [Clostridiales bacterium]|nr:HNH endonuclease [Clostridiales bacterium]
MIERIRQFIIYRNSPALLLLLFLVVSLIIYIAFLIVTSIKKKKEYKLNEIARGKVIEESERYHYLLNLESLLNQKGIMQLEPVYGYNIPYKSKTLYDNRNESRYIKSKIQEKKESIVYILKSAFRNRRLLSKYDEMLLKAPALDEENEDKRYRKAESDMCRRLEERIKPVVPIFKFYFTYKSPHGRNSYQSASALDLDEMVDYLTQIKDEIGYRETVQYQRSLMTQSLRYDVMKRDHFRCVLCGRTADDDIKLHVDHIVPVAKGGKTVMENLRTLCEDCNRGKRDKYDENGEN